MTRRCPCGADLPKNTTARCRRCAWTRPPSTLSADAEAAALDTKRRRVRRLLLAGVIS